MTAAAAASVRPAADLLHEARARERAACIPEAIAGYEAAVATAERTAERAVLAEALRRLAVLRHQRNESTLARELCRRSEAVAAEDGDTLLVAEALNSLGCIDLRTGALADARDHLQRALEAGKTSLELGARVEQNLGIVANIQGDIDAAVAHYQRSFAAYRMANDEHGCAIALHNLGMVSADRQHLEAADHYFTQSFAIAERVGDLSLKGLTLVNHAEVYVAQGRYEDARRNAEAALALFDQLDARADKAEAYRVLGMVYRETGKPQLAESRLRTGVELAVEAGSVLNEAEASRELAVLYQTMGRNQEALRLFHTAHRLFGRLDARIDLVHVAGKKSDLELTYFAAVREWGQSIESSDTYTFGHCERVARHALAVAVALGLDDIAQTTIRLGAYLHDLGKVKVPHEILNKPGPLTHDEMDVVRMHPIWGIELLAAVDFPWDLKPIIRWHHERYDGTGYPDRLRGDEFPVAAQIVGIVDMYDALTTARPYRGALTRETALAEIAKCRNWWSEEVYGAFLRNGDARPEPHAVAQASPS